MLTASSPRAANSVKRLTKFETQSDGRRRDVVAIGTERDEDDDADEDEESPRRCKRYEERQVQTEFQSIIIQQAADANMEQE